MNQASLVNPRGVTFILYIVHIIALSAKKIVISPRDLNKNKNHRSALLMYKLRPGASDDLGHIVRWLERE